MPLADSISPYATAPTNRLSHLGAPMAIFSALALCLPLAVLGFGGPKFGEIFRDFGVQLPPFTRLLLDIGNAVGTPVGLCIAGGILIIWFVAVCITARAARPLAIGMLLFSVLFSFVMLAASVFAFHMPLTEMIEQLQR